jgi:endonuclease YncB( thermonuclease family)
VAAPIAPKPDPLVFGRWPVAAEHVIDGDTLRIPGQPSVRVRAVDCEEAYRSDKDRAAAATDFPAYAREKRGDHPGPRKYGTPLGEAATRYLRALAAQATHVRLERDRLGGHELDTYDRRLAHVFFELPDREVLVSEELIRLGYSPYFVKYGRSLRFDARLRKAEMEARGAERGLWGDPPPHHYPDYPERLRWWHARAKQVDAWRTHAEQPDRITLGTVRAEERLAARVGKPAVVFGLFSGVVDTKDGTKRVAFLGHRKGRSFPLVFFDKTIFDGLDRSALDSRFLTVRGVITLYRGKPQMVVERAEQISTQ